MGSIINYTEQKIQEVENTIDVKETKALTEEEIRFINKMESSEEVEVVTKTNFNRVSVEDT